MKFNFFKKINLVSIIQLLLAILLLVCLFKMPYGYYQFVRVAATAGFAFLAYKAFSSQKTDTGVVFVILAVLFQPFFKIALGKNAWHLVDIIVAILLLFMIFYNKPKK